VKHQAVLDEWAEVQRRREMEIEQAIVASGGKSFDMTQEPGTGVFHLPDSFTVRAQVSGVYFRDIAQNHPHVFQITEPEGIEYNGDQSVTEPPAPDLVVNSPADDAPAVCIIDSGIEEGHVYLRPAIITAESRCFLPGTDVGDTADYFPPNGHGTRVAGTVLYPRIIPVADPVTPPCWLHNARVLDANCDVPDNLMPALYMEAVIRHFSDAARQRPARLFNHSINATEPGRSVHMSTWGAAIDKISFERDVLIIQSAGNILGGEVARYLRAGRAYPDYQFDPASRVRNPGQSLSALTVGSVAHTFWQNGQRRSLATTDHPSAFSPAGPGIWDSIKPDVVEYGGDYVVDDGPPQMVFQSGAVAHEMIRATRHGPGATSKDDVGTSFATPKVSYIAATLARELPAEPCLLYRALIANSARWPQWAEEAAVADKLNILRQIGYGIPDVIRATANTDYRITLVTSGTQRIPAREAHVYHIPVPEQLRRPEEEFLIRIDVTLSYVAQPRRTRRRIAGYLATRLDWDVSKAGESAESFRNRIFHDGDKNNQDGGDIFQWILRDNVDYGVIKGLSRQNSTLQKDWCYIRSHELPPDFSIAVVGHPGWDPRQILWQNMRWQSRSRR
jgi:subtilisin family serine protease